jgi:hypothetical protein
MNNELIGRCPGRTRSARRTRPIQPGQLQLGCCEAVILRSMVLTGVQSNATSKSELGRPAAKDQSNIRPSSAWMHMKALMMYSGNPIIFAVCSTIICSYLDDIQKKK